MAPSRNKHVARTIALAQERVSEPVLAAGIVHRKGFARRSVAYLIAIGIVFGLGGVLGGVLLIAIGAAILWGARAAYGALRGGSETKNANEFPPHAVLAVSEERVHAFAAMQKQAWLRGGWGTYGWRLGDEVGSWERSAVAATATKNFNSWKLILRSPGAEPQVLEAQAYGARGSNEELLESIGAASDPALA